VVQIRVPISADFADVHTIITVWNLYGNHTSRPVLEQSFAYLSHGSPVAPNPSAGNSAINSYYYPNRLQGQSLTVARTLSL
jgi:hypothetical protein